MLLSEPGAVRLHRLKDALSAQHDHVMATLEGILACETTAEPESNEASLSKCKFKAHLDVVDSADVEPVLECQQLQSTYFSDEVIPDMPVARERKGDDDDREISYLQIVDAPTGAEVNNELTESMPVSDVTALRTDAPQLAVRTTQSWKWNATQSQLKEKAIAIAEDRRTAATRLRRLSSSSVLAAKRKCSAALKRTVQNRIFELASAASIAGNAIWLGIQVQFAAENRGRDTPEVFQWVEYLFTAMYSVELLLRFLAEGISFLSPQKRNVRWNYFDVVCVLSSIVGLFLDGFAADEEHASWVSPIGRLARIGRVVRILRLVKFVTQLRAIVATLWSTVSSMFWALALMGFVMYIFAVVITQAAVTHSFQHAGTEVAGILDLNFGSVPLAVYTLFKSVTNGNAWETAAEVLMHVHPMYFYLYIMYVCVIVFAFMNVMTGFICEQAFATVQRDKEMAVEAQVRHKEVYTQKFAELFGTMDHFDTGELTVDELEKHIEDDTVKAYFEHLDLDIDKAWDIFRLLDIDENGTVSMQEFVVGCLKLRGQARSMDLAIIGYDFQRVAEKLSEFMEFVEQQLTQINRASGSGGLVRRFSQVMNSPVMSRRSIISGRKSMSSSLVGGRS